MVMTTDLPSSCSFSQWGSSCGTYQTPDFVDYFDCEEISCLFRLPFLGALFFKVKETGYTYIMEDGSTTNVMPLMRTTASGEDARSGADANA
jgi:hypothetical protein